MANDSNKKVGLDEAYKLTEGATRSQQQLASVAAVISQTIGRMTTVDQVQATSAEQVRQAVGAMAMTLDETGDALSSLAKGQVVTRDSTRAAQQDADAAAAALEELATSVGAVRKDALLLTA